MIYDIVAKYCFITYLFNMLAFSLTMLDMFFLAKIALVNTKMCQNGQNLGVELVKMGKNTPF